MTGIERGKHNVSLDILDRLAKGLRIDTGELLTEAEKDALPERGAQVRAVRRAVGESNTYSESCHYSIARICFTRCVPSRLQSSSW